MIRHETVEELLGRQLNNVEERYAPKTLYIEGDSTLLRKGVRVSVVGSRRASEEGRRRAHRLTKTLAEQGITVVSGLARGIDAEAHWTTIRHGGRTIGVLGTGLDRAYPPENQDLQRLLAREHLLVSQFPLGTPSLRGNFPQRNRTMALVSDATVIVEASERSGTQSQAWETLRLGRPLFLLRSLIENGSAPWAAKLVYYGARVLAEPEELIEELPSPDLEPLAAFAF